MKKRLLVPILAGTLLAGGASRLIGTCGPFTDVTAFCPFILQLYYLGIAAGTSETTFSPDQPLTRRQAAVFISKAVETSIKRSSRRAALGQWWTTTNPQRIPIPGASYVACDGTDVWVSGNAGIVRVHGSDGKILGTWTGPVGRLLAVAGKILVIGSEHLYVLDPSQPPGTLTTVADGLPVSATAIAFDGSRIWIAANSGTLWVVTPGSSPPWPVQTISLPGQSQIGSLLFDGSNIWASSGAQLLRLDASGTIIQTIDLTMWNLFFDGVNIWGASSDGEITIIRAATGARVATVVPGIGDFIPSSQAFDGERVLFGDNLGQHVVIFRAQDFQLLKVLPGDAPLSACSDGINFWVTEHNFGELRRF